MSEVRRYPARPFLGVGALIFSNSKILLVQRGNPPFVDWWSLPGGVVESGERLEDALRREVFEETGLNVEVSSIATVFERIMRDDAGECEYHYVLVDFYCIPLSTEIQAGSDSKQVKWFVLDELDQLQLTEGTLSVIHSCVSGQPTHPLVTRP